MIRQACSRAGELASSFAPLTFDCERYTEKHPHPEEQEAFVVRVRLPWHTQDSMRTRVSIEITRVEKVMCPVRSRPVLHGYGETLEAEVLVYALEEIVAEKLRAILQHAAKLRARGWSRSRARDYYDLWRIMGAYAGQLEMADFPALLKAKCTHRSVSFTGVEDFFSPQMLELVSSTWDQWLGPLVPQLPAFELVLGDLRPQIAAYLLISITNREDAARP